MPVITSITKQKKGERVNIFLDGEFYCGLDGLTMLKFGLKEGMEIEGYFEYVSLTKGILLYVELPDEDDFDYDDDFFDDFFDTYQEVVKPITTSKLDPLSVISMFSA